MPQSIRTRVVAPISVAAAMLGGLAALAVPATGASASPTRSLGSVKATAAPDDWLSGGQNNLDTRSNPGETAISAANAGTLKSAWTYTTAGNVSATPAVVGGVVYFPDAGGYLNAVNATTGAQIWRQTIASYDGISGAVSRTSPAVANGVVYIGDQNQGHLMAISAATGKLIWVHQLDTHPAAILTQSPIVSNGVVYEGVSSNEEGLSLNPLYPCCTFRGSMVAVNAKTGRLLWKTYMVPANGGKTGGYSGGAVWGSTPAIDTTTNTVYVATGNNYTVPATTTACENKTGATADKCLSPADHIDSIVALDGTTGKVKWALNQHGFDTWTAGCVLGGLHCPPAPDAGPDADFASGPNLFTITNSAGKPQLVVGAGEKSGQYWAIDAATGNLLWGTQAGPGSNLGGIMWGSATDGKRIYIAEADGSGASYTPFGSTTAITGGSWAALDPATGKILWQTPDPTGASDSAAVSEANGVVYASSFSGSMYALNASSGKILWSYKGAGANNAGPAIVGNYVYWGSGYTVLAPSESTNFYAFSVTP